MSFSSELKRELAEEMPKSRHCMTAELKALLDTDSPKVRRGKEGTEIVLVQTELEAVAKKVFTIASKTFSIVLLCSENGRGTGSFSIYTRDRQAVARLEQNLMKPDLLKKGCCRRAYLRGAFLAGGTISDPNHYYNLEIVCSAETMADELKNLMCELGLRAKKIQRKGQPVVYLQEAEQISEMLRLMGAGRSLMEFENIRIIREMRGNVNRQVNCETANLKKTVSAAHRQLEDIIFLKEQGALQTMSPALLRIAEARIEYPEASLTELGECLNPPIGKSGVNHRMRKLQEMADEIRRGSENPS